VRVNSPPQPPATGPAPNGISFSPTQVSVCPFLPRFHLSSSHCSQPNVPSRSCVTPEHSFPRWPGSRVAFLSCFLVWEMLVGLSIRRICTLRRRISSMILTFAPFSITMAGFLVFPGYLPPPLLHSSSWTPEVTPCFTAWYRNLV